MTTVTYGPTITELLRFGKRSCSLKRQWASWSGCALQDGGASGSTDFAVHNSSARVLSNEGKRSILVPAGGQCLNKCDKFLKRLKPQLLRARRTFHERKKAGS